MNPGNRVFHLKEFMNNTLKIFGQEIIDQKTIDQIKNCYDPEVDRAVLTADAHYG